LKKYNTSTKLSFLKKHFNVLAFILGAACAAGGSYGIFQLMGYLESMGTGIGDQITINKYLFSAPIFLFFVLVVINFWRKGFPTTLLFSKNALAATIAIYISIFIIGGMVSRTLFAKRAEFYGYTNCPDKNYSNGIEVTNRPNVVRPTSITWLPKDRCKEVRQEPYPNSHKQ